jgi:spermidine synthase
MLVLILFFCSGATALVYEVLWSKYLALMFGSTVYAQTVILAVFMGGLALGNRLFGNRADALRQPLAVYGYLEIGIGLVAFLFHQFYELADMAFVALGSHLLGSTFLLLLLKVLISIALLIVPTVLMGGTLPLLASWIQQHFRLDWASRVSLFYAINSLGAVTGAGLAGFFLVQKYGMIFSLQIGAAVNLSIGVIALIISRQDMTLSSAVRAPVAQNGESGPQPFSWRGLALLVAVTGGVSMGLEVLSSRALALIVGGSLQAFAVMLMSFILGIGIGSLVISSSRLAGNWGIHTMYFLLTAAATVVGVSLMGIKLWVVVYSQARFGLASNANGYFWHQAVVGLMAFAVLGVPAAFIGATVPFSIMLLEKSGTAAAYVGRLLTWNTIGAVIGIMLTGFVLMPLLGLRGSIATLAFVLLGAVAFMAFTRNHRRVWILSIVVSVCLIVGISSTGEDWKQILSGGVFRVRDRALNFAELKMFAADTDLLLYEDAADATVSVHVYRGAGRPVERLLKINGKTDASTYGDAATQYMLAHLPIMARPDAREAFVLGFGSGITAGALLEHPLERITIAENCRPVLRAAPLFAEWNHGILTNSRARVFNEDARTVLKLSPQKYDVIICEPSNPWVAGVGSVFSRDFYELASSRLSDGGIMAQWFHIYEMSDDIVNLVIRTFSSVFPEIEIWDVEKGDIILLGSKKPWASTPAQYEKVFERPLPKADLQRIGLSTPAAVWTRQIASQRTAFALAREGPIQTDEFPILEYEAPKAFFVGAVASGLFMFDERTWQFALAAPEKVRTMQALPRKLRVDALQAVIGSSNNDLNKYRYFLAQGGVGPISGLDPRIQLVFRVPEDYPEAVESSAALSKENQRLIQWELLILRHPEKAKTAIAEIEKVLSQMIAEKKLTADFSPQFYAAMAARFAMRDGEYLEAMRLLKIGMIFAPEGQQLLYLSRVLDRMLPPEMLEKLKAGQTVDSTNAPPDHRQ